MSNQADVAIIDYGLGNLFSIKNACETAGLSAVITGSVVEMNKASALILPGVGAFAEAINHLKKLDLISPLRDLAGSGKPMIGICLGMQLLLSESHEFGRHAGLGIIPGQVLPLKDQLQNAGGKVPHIGWSRIVPDAQSWESSLLKKVRPDAMMYFVHSYYCQPADPSVILSRTSYGGFNFCSSLSFKNITAFQFHPERSGAEGLLVYRNLASNLKKETAKHV